MGPKCIHVWPSTDQNLANECKLLAISFDINIVGCYPRVSETSHTSHSASPAVEALTFNRKANSWATSTACPRFSCSSQETELTCKTESKFAYTKHYPSSFSQQVTERESGSDTVTNKARSVGKWQTSTTCSNILFNSEKSVGEHKGQRTLANLASIRSDKTCYIFFFHSV